MPQVKIIPFDPKEILGQQIVQPQTRVIRINPDQLKLDNVLPTGQRDILREAAQHILHEDNQQQQHQSQQLQTLGGVLISAGGQDQHHHHDSLVISSPGFVRVTPNYISVKSPLAKRPQKVKKAPS